MSAPTITPPGDTAAMRVHAHGGPDVLVADRVPVPVPGAGEVGIAVAAAGVNFPDLLVISGQYQTLPPLPFVPGKEVAGTVTSVGPGVTGFAPGNRVMAQLEHGGYAGQVVAPAAATFAVPEGIGFEAAVALGLVYQTAWFALMDRGGFAEGQSVLVTGATGGVGLAAVQLVRALGGVAIAGIRNMGQAEAMRAHGAAAVIDLSAPNLRDAVRDQVRAATDGRGVDLVVEQVGGDVFDGAIRALAWCGRLVVVGFAGGRIPAAKANYLLVRNIAVAGLQWSDYRDRAPERVAEAQRRIWALCQARQVMPVIHSVLPLSEAGAALGQLRRGGVLGRIVLKPD